MGVHIKQDRYSRVYCLLRQKLWHTVATTMMLSEHTPAKVLLHVTDLHAGRRLVRVLVYAMSVFLSYNLYLSRCKQGYGRITSFMGLLLTASSFICRSISSSCSKNTVSICTIRNMPVHLHVWMAMWVRLRVVNLADLLVHSP